MISGMFGLIASFIVIAIVVLWVFIKPQTSPWIKAALIPVVVWYGFGLYFSVGGLMGWPVRVSSIYELPNRAIVKYISVVEPTKDREGGVYFLLLTLQKQDEFKFSLDPRKVFKYDGGGQPRFYVVDYNEELDKNMRKKKKDAKEGMGIIILEKNKGKKGKKKKGEEGKWNLEEDPFKVLKPQDILKKESN